MDTIHNIVPLISCIFAAAVLYSSVGHGGASAYLAVMALWGVAPQVMRPTALILNIFVSSIATVRFARAGCFEWRRFWPFAIASVPAAFLGGAISLPGSVYKRIVGVVLLFASLRIAAPRKVQTALPSLIPIVPALACGCAIGLLSGLTGVGGGIFLSPILVLAGWADAKSQAGTTAPFILANSVAGISGQQLARVSHVPGEVAYLVVAGVIGGVIGSGIGSRRLRSHTLRHVLAAVLAVAAAKFLLT